MINHLPWLAPSIILCAHILFGYFSVLIFCFCYCFRKKRQLDVESSHCFSVPPWFRPLDKRTMSAWRTARSPFRHMHPHRKCRLILFPQTPLGLSLYISVVCSTIPAMILRVDTMQGKFSAYLQYILSSAHWLVACGVWCFCMSYQRCPRVGLGEFQEQPAVWHLNRSPTHVLRRYAEICVLLVPIGLGSMEPQTGGSCGFRLYSGDHCRWHCPPLCWCYPLGGDWRVCRRGGCSEAGQYPDIHTNRCYPEEAEASREPVDEAGHAVPPACSGRRCIPSDSEWSRSQASTWWKRLLEARGEGPELDCWTGGRPEALVACISLPIEM